MIALIRSVWEGHLNATNRSNIASTMHGKGMVQKTYKWFCSLRSNHVGLQKLVDVNMYRSKGSQILSHSCCLLARADQLSFPVLMLSFQQPLSDCIFVSVVSVMAGLLALLLIVLEWTRPGLPSPLRPICDLRVLNHFIKEARDAEVAMVRGKCMHAFRSRSRWRLLLRYCGPGITLTKCFMHH